MKLTKYQSLMMGADRKKGGWVAVALVVLFILSELLRPKPKVDNAQPASLGDFQFPTATEGRSVTLIWGTNKIKGVNVIWYGDLFQEARTEKLKTGLFTSTKFIVGYNYHLGVQVALSRGPGVIMNKMWIGTKLAFSGVLIGEQTFTIDDPEFFGGDDLGNGGFIGTFKFYSGEAFQPVSTYLNQHQVEGTKTPAYRGLSYIAPDTERIYVGNSTSIADWSFELERIPNGLNLTTSKKINGADANPLNVIYEIMTDTDWGLGFPGTDIDFANFRAAAEIVATEGNGFSFVLDKPKEAVDLIKMIEVQIDGLVFFDQIAKQWKIKLARFDYDPNTIPEINETNIVEIRSFARSSWEDTTNQIRVSYVDRTDEYKETFALAIDMANQRLQDNVNIIFTKSFPGVKVGATANYLAWRLLKVMSYPLAKASIVVGREFFNVNPGDVLAFTDASLNFNRLPMRISKITFGDLTDNEILLTLIQDIFSFEIGRFADPPSTGWQPPSDVLQPFLPAQQIAFEAPRAFVTRDPDFAGEVDKIWVGARRVGPEVSFKIVERHAVNPSAPAGLFTEVGEVFALLKMGQLSGTLLAGSVYPLSSILLDPTINSQLDIIAAFTTTSDRVDIGTNLINLILIDDEFMLCEGAQASATKIQINNIWRGVMDSVQKTHVDGADVFMLFVGGGLADGTFTPGDNVDIKLLPRSISDEVLETAATAIQIVPMDNRLIRPYPPIKLILAGVSFGTTTSLEVIGTVPEDFAIVISTALRDFRTVDEATALITDPTNIFSDFPAANNTRGQFDVYNDPDGLNTLLFTENFASTSVRPLRIKILKATDGVLPLRMRFVLRTLHDVLSVTYASRQEIDHSANITSDLTGDFNFGARDSAVVSNVYTSTVTGQYDFTLSTAFAVGDVEYRLNGGVFTLLIAATNTTGNIALVTATDTIEVRHLSTDIAVTKQLTMVAAGVGQDAYFIPFT